MDQMEVDKEQLLHEFAAGREPALDAVFTELYPALCAYGSKITGSRQAAEDMASDALLKAWNRRASFGSYNGLKAFLYTVMRNACINWMDRQRTQDKMLRVLPSFAELERTRLEDMIEAETYRALHMAIGHLPGQCQQVVRMAYLEKKNLRQIAGLLGIAVGTAKSHRTRGVMLLKKRLGYFGQLFF